MWEELYEAHAEELLAYGIHMCQNRALAEDLLQETFVKAMIHADTVVDLSPGKRRAWLYRTFKNLFFDRCRRAVLEMEYQQVGEPGYTADQGMLKIVNAMLLQRLQPQDRAMFQLRYFDGYSAEEIARMMELPPGTVRSRLSRCRKVLKRELEL